MDKVCEVMDGLSLILVCISICDGGIAWVEGGLRL